jgi:Secretion system C-terminal sorting domain
MKTRMKQQRNIFSMASKPKILLLLLIITNCSFGQRIKFTFDAAGNQTKRAICSGCAAKNAKDSDFKNEATVKNDDLLPSDIEKISYYPNPVREELYVKWENLTDNFVTQIDIYTITGQLMKTYENQKGFDTTTISFQTYPEGFYNLVLNYTNGETKTLKIIKQQ